jgi:hypothetical protein
VWKFKVGITSLHIGAKKRAANIDKQMFGFPFPIMVVPVPGAYHIEQEMHRIMRRWNTRFYKGSGRSEWFNIAPLFFTVPIQLAIWGLYLVGIDLIFGTRIAPVVFELVVDAGFFIFKTFELWST